MFSVILNLEDTASSAYAVVADSFSDGEEILENVQEYEILSVEPLVRCRDCKHRRTPTCFFYEVIKQEDRWMEEVHYRRIDHTQDEDFCSRGVRKDG